MSHFSLNLFLDKNNAVVFATVPEPSEAYTKAKSPGVSADQYDNHGNGHMARLQISKCIGAANYFILQLKCF